MLYNALRYTRHNCRNLQVTMFDYFDWYSLNEEGSYCCGSDKRTAMVNGALQKAGSGSFGFLGDDGRPTSQPLNAVFGAMLRWFKVRYERLAPSTVSDPQVGGANWVDVLMAQDQAAAAAEATQANHMAETAEVQEQKQAPALLLDPLPIDSHAALLKLLDVVLKQPWPRNDVVGDQLKKSKEAEKPIPAPIFHSDPQPGDTDNEARQDTSEILDADGEGNSSNGGSDDGDDVDALDLEEPTAKRRRSRTDLKGKGREVETSMEVAEDRRPHCPPVRTRGARLTRGSGSRSTASMYKLRSGRS